MLSINKVKVSVTYQFSQESEVFTFQVINVHLFPVNL